MAGHEHEAARTPPQAARQTPPGRGMQAPSLPSAIGNRAMTRMVARMEAADAVDAFAESLAPGVMGAEQRVVDTMAGLSHDVEGFDKAATDFEKKTKAPLAPSLSAVPPAAAQVPEGWYPGISGGSGAG
jgi:hypothetical protein